MATAVKLFANNKGNISYSWNDDKRSYLLIKLVREGISYSDFNKVTELAPFTTKEWTVYLNISIRTMERHREENKVFRKEQSERILSIYQLLNYGQSIFGDSDNFFDWINSESIALGGIKPKDLLDTSIGINMVKDELGRLEHGVLT